MIQKVLFTWSGGKDSALALYELQKNNGYEVLALLTTLTEGYNRISMHGVRRVLLEEQARSLNLPLEIMYITQTANNDEYIDRLKKTLESYKGKGATVVVFGDIFLEDLRKYRESHLAEIGMKAVFPLWKRNTAELACAFINLGFKAVVTCVDSNILGKEFTGREFDEQFLAELPYGVDPCGENGEFHSFVYAGPIFQKRVSCKKGEIVLRDSRFYYCDLIPA